MIRKLSKHGNSLALIIPSSVRDLLNWTEDQEVEITTDGIRLYISPVKSDILVNNESSQ